jgi:hypothetical protein
MTAAQQQEKIQRTPAERRPPNAEHVTSIAVDFLKILGNKRGIRPKKVSLQGEVYVVELDIGKEKTAVVQIEVQTREIKEYEIKTVEKEESGTGFPLSPKTLIMIFGISAITFLLLEAINVPSFFPGH